MIIKVPQIAFNKLWLFALVFGLSVSCKNIEVRQTEVSKNISVPPISVSQEELILEANKGLVYYENEPFSGFGTTHFENGQIATSNSYFEGKKEGVSLKWFDNGCQSYLGQYSNGKLDGKSYSWWDNGNLRTETNYVKGIGEGKQLQWYVEGPLFKAINLAQGQENGLQQSWRKNGKLYNNYEVKDGRTYGLKRSSLCFQLDDEKLVTVK